jgi:hypothetical protein
MAKVNLMTQAQYARHRGCSKVAVGKAVKAQRISLVNGLIDPAVADIQWKANSRARVSATPTPDQPSLLHALAQNAAADVSTPDGYTLSRNRREAADAEMAELKLAEQQGLLIRVDAVKAVLAAAFTSTRDNLLQIPSRLSAILAAETDAAKVHELLQAELYRALEGMAAVQNSNRLAGREKAQ